MRPIYYDTETTGLRKEKDAIVEIAAYDPVMNKTFCEFVNPGFPIPAESSNIHGITDEMVKEAPSFKEIGAKFIAFCEGDTVLIAHNNENFDAPFLAAEFGKHDLIPPEWPMIDSLKWARKYRPDLPKHTLQYLRQVYGFKENQAHRALDDVKILYQIFSTMIDDLSIKQVYDLLGAPTDVFEMPFGKHQGKPLDQVPPDYIAWLKKSGALDKPGNGQLKEAFAKLNS